MIQKKITYEDYQEFSGESELSLEEVQDLFKRMHWENEAFLYFPITSQNLLQVAFTPRKGLMAEITNDGEDMVFLKKYVTNAEALDLITALFNSEKVTHTEGFYQVPINTTTLDKVMQNQKPI